MANPEKKAKQYSIGWLVLIAVALWIFYNGGLGSSGTVGAGAINEKVANEAVERYNIAKRSGSTMDTCVQAGMVVASYLQAKNEAKFAEWKEVERADCLRAGIKK